MKKDLKPTHDFPHNQEISFDNKTRLFVKDIIKIEQQNWVTIYTKTKKHIINPDRVLFITFSK